MPACNKELRELPCGEDWMGDIHKGEGWERQGSGLKSAVGLDLATRLCMGGAPGKV